MKASTHTEIYRRFEGELKPTPLRFLTITTSSIRLAFKRKLPALLLFLPTSIGAIVGCVLVYVKFSGLPGLGGEQGETVAQMAGSLIEVSQQIVGFVTAIPVRLGALLTISWYGAGLIAEDRRLGAHLLYFARPMTRLDYLLGKFFAAAFYGACSLLFPSLLICAAAAFFSPDWVFLREEGDVILKTIGYCLLWIFTVTAIVLCISSMVDRKTLALVSVFGVVLLAEAAANVLALLTEESRFRLISLFTNFEHIANWTFDRRLRYSFEPTESLLVVLSLFVLSLLILSRRLRRMEVVG